MHKFQVHFALLRQHMMTLTLTLALLVCECSPLRGHWNQALNHDARKVRSLQEAYEPFYAVISATSRRSHRSRIKTKHTFDLPLYRQGSTMILDEDLYPPRHKTVVKFRYVTH